MTDYHSIGVTGRKKGELSHLSVSRHHCFPFPSCLHRSSVGDDVWSILWFPSVAGMGEPKCGKAGCRYGV